MQSKTSECHLNIISASRQNISSFKNSLWNRHHFQDIHTHSRVVPELLHEPTVYDVSLCENNWMMKNPVKKKHHNAEQRDCKHRPYWLNPTDGEWCRCNVSGHDTLSDSCRWRLKYMFLLICDKTLIKHCPSYLCFIWQYNHGILKTYLKHCYLWIFI